MQDCSKYDSMLSAYLDGELHGAEAKALEKHLRTCEDCQKYLALLKSVKEGLKEDLPPAPETLRQGIAYKLELEGKRQKLYFGAFGRWTAIAAVLCVVIFGVVRLTGSGMNRASQAVPAAGAGVSASKGATGGAAADAGSAEALLESKGEAPASAPMSAPAAANGAAEPFADGAAEEESVSYASGTDAAPAATSAPGAEAPAPEAPASVYLTDSLRGSDAGLNALKEGEVFAVLIFYDALPEDVRPEGWAMQTPREGELARWLVPAEALEALMEAGSGDEIYFGEGMAEQGLVVLIAGEEE